MSLNSILILGSTGLVGGAILRQLAAEEASLRSLTTITRRAIPFPLASREGVTETVEPDSTKWASLVATTKASVVYSGLGTTKGIAGGFAQQYKIDHDLNLELAKAAKEAGATTYILISSKGASATSFLPYLKMKGELEERVLELGFENTVILRPAALLGNRDADHGLLAKGMASVCSILHGTMFTPLAGYPVKDVEVAKASIAYAQRVHDGTADPKNKGVIFVESKEIYDMSN